MSVAQNSKIDKRSSLASVDSHGSELTPRDESGVLVTRIQLKVGPVCGSDSAESAASVAGLSLPSSGGAIYSGSRARAVTGTIPWAWSDDRFKSCSSWQQGVAAVVSNPSKIKSPRISAT